MRPLFSGIFRIIYIQICFLFGLVLVSAQRTDGPSNSILWEIKHPETGNRSYLYALPEFFSTGIPKGVQDAFLESNELVLMFPLQTEQNFEEAKAKLFDSKILSEFITKLPEKEQRYWIQKLGTYGIESSELQKPILEVINKLIHVLAKESEENWMIEQKNFTKLANGRGVKVNFVNNSVLIIPEDRENEAFQSLQNIIKDPEKFQGILAKLKLIRKEGGIPSEDLLSKLFKNYPVFTHSSLNVTSFESNQWMEGLKKKTVFLAIPERLLLGKSGLISEMKKKGFRMRPLIVH